eukprot:2686203-Prymnesium_polylepis.1
MVTLKVRKLTSDRRVVEGGYEVLNPLSMSPKPSPTINELMASRPKRLLRRALNTGKHGGSTSQLLSASRGALFGTHHFIHSIIARPPSRFACERGRAET